MKGIQTEVIELHEQGYNLAEIAEELGITKNKVKALLETEIPAPTPATKLQKRKFGNATEKLKQGFDELVENLQNLYEEELDEEESKAFLEQCRKLEFQFRKVAQEHELNYVESEHWEALQDLIQAIKEPIQELDEDEVYEFELEGDLYTLLDDLRFELISWQA